MRQWQKSDKKRKFPRCKVESGREQGMETWPGVGIHVTPGLDCDVSKTSSGKLGGRATHVSPRMHSRTHTLYQFPRV
ncbi:hypothetical protein RRG08_050565 [Elysia crispata]|uniref:Uncharacterized protein n=1 Tax=Elysia crispata TaxID=231223 RepID=A0AAE0Z8K2_9GAST|nr:hypothetical protein RRG08_050565 [Elysia crispata]